VLFRSPQNPKTPIFSNETNAINHTKYYKLIQMKGSANNNNNGGNAASNTPVVAPATSSVPNSQPNNS